MNLADRVMTVKQGAAYLHVSPGTLYRAIHAGEVPAVRIGRRIVLPGAALQRLLEGGEAVREPSE